MGRCYEFVTVIRDGCDHPMTVAPGGGICECRTCGTVCTGRYAGCASILARKGYVPALAALPAPTPAPAPTPVEMPRRREDQPAGDDGTMGRLQMALAELRVATGATEQNLGAAIERISRELAERDGELASAFERLVASFGRVTEEVRDQRARADEIAEALTRLSSQVASLESEVCDARTGTDESLAVLARLSEEVASLKERPPSPIDALWALRRRQTGTS